MTNSSWEDFFSVQIKEAGLPEPVTQYRFVPPRRFRFDFAYPELKLAIEINGGVYSGGRHTTGKGYTADMEKLSLAAIEGYKVIQATTGQVSQGKAIEWVKEYFKRNVNNAPKHTAY